MVVSLKNKKRKQKNIMNANQAPVTSNEQEPAAPINLTEAEYSRIADMEVGDEMSDADKAFLTEKGITLESGDVSVSVDGGTPRLMDTSVADFGTRISLKNMERAAGQESDREAAVWSEIAHHFGHEFGNIALSKTVEVSDVEPTEAPTVATLEVAEPEKVDEERVKAIELQISMLSYQMGDFINHGDLHLLGMGLSNLSNMIAEYRSVDPQSKKTQTLENARIALQSQSSVDMQNNEKPQLALYEPALVTLQQLTR